MFEILTKLTAIAYKDPDEKISTVPLKFLIVSRLFLYRIGIGDISLSLICSKIPRFTKRAVKQNMLPKMVWKFQKIIGKLEKCSNKTTTDKRMMNSEIF